MNYLNETEVPTELLIVQVLTSLGYGRVAYGHYTRTDEMQYAGYDPETGEREIIDVNYDNLCRKFRALLGNPESENFEERQKARRIWALYEQYLGVGRAIHQCFYKALNASPETHLRAMMQALQ